MNLQQLNSSTVMKVQKYLANKTNVVAEMQKNMADKRLQIDALNMELESLEQDYLVDFDASIRKQMNEIKKKMVALHEEINDDAKFMGKAIQKTLALTDSDYEELKTTFDNARKDHDKKYQALQKKKQEVIEAFIEYDSSYSELHELHHELELLMYTTFGEAECRKVKAMLSFVELQQVKDESFDLSQLFASAPINHKKGATLVRAINPFTSTNLAMRKGEYKSINNEKVVNDLIQSGLVTKVV